MIGNNILSAIHGFLSSLASAVNPLGGIDVRLQDQTTRPIIVKFNKVTNSTTLSVPAVKGAYTITVTNTTGFVDTKYIILFEPASVNFSFYNQVGAPAGNVITLDTPLDFAYSAGTFVDAAITNMNVNGAVTPQVFGLRGTGAPPGVDIDVDITRIIFSCLTASAIDNAKFGDLARLTRGLVLRKRNDLIENVFNVKSNGEIEGIMYDYTPRAATNPQQGIDGFSGRLTFGGQSKIGVVIRLPIGEDAEVLIQDNLTGLTSLEITAEGHVVD